MAKRIAASKAIDQEEAPAAFWHQNDWHLNLTNISRDQVNPQGVRKLPGHQAAFFRCYRPHKEWACRGSFRAWSNRSWNKSFFPQVNWILLQCSSLEIPNSRGRGPQLWKLFFKKCILRTVATIPTLRNTLLYTCVFSNNYQAFLFRVRFRVEQQAVQANGRTSRITCLLFWKKGYHTFLLHFWKTDIVTSTSLSPIYQSNNGRGVSFICQI